MKKLILGCALLILLSSTVFATWLLIPLKDLIMDTQVIVVGTLRTAKEDSDVKGEGYVLVDEVPIQVWECLIWPSNLA